MAARPDWAVCLFTSELSFLFHLPIFLRYQAATGSHPASRRLQRVLFLVRLVLHTAAVPLLLWHARDDLLSWRSVDSALGGSPQAWYGWVLMAVSLALWAVTYVHHRLHFRMRPVTQPDRLLYLLSHASVVNFLFDVPGRGLQSARTGHVLVVAINIVAATVLLATWATATPLRRAWGCYDPAFIDSYSDYNRGICPDDANSNENICTERPYTNCEVNFKTDVLHAEGHYATQAVLVSLIVYAVGIPGKLTFYTLAAYTGG